MEHKFSIGKFPPGKRDYLSGIPFIPENFQWNEPKSRVPFTTRPEFPEFSNWLHLAPGARQNGRACAVIEPQIVLCVDSAFSCGGVVLVFPGCISFSASLRFHRLFVSR